MSSYLDKYRDCEVEIHYLTDGSSLRDRGHLADFGDGWIELHKSGNCGETFLIPTSAVRLIKLLDAPQDEGNRLLRAVTETPVEAAKREQASDETRLSGETHR
jgi:hypothetical protein